MANECWHKSLSPLMDTVRDKMGDRPVYISFDIDGIDPGFCPGTGEHICYCESYFSNYVDDESPHHPQQLR